MAGSTRGEGRKGDEACSCRAVVWCGVVVMVVSRLAARALLTCRTLGQVFCLTSGIESIMAQVYPDSASDGY